MVGTMEGDLYIYKGVSGEVNILISILEIDVILIVRNIKDMSIV